MINKKHLTYYPCEYPVKLTPLTSQTRIPPTPFFTTKNHYPEINKTCLHS